MEGHPHRLDRSRRAGGRNVNDLEARNAIRCRQLRDTLSCWVSQSFPLGIGSDLSDFLCNAVSSLLYTFRLGRVA